MRGSNRKHSKINRNIFLHENAKLSSNAKQKDWTQKGNQKMLDKKKIKEHDKHHEEHQNQTNESTPVPRTKPLQKDVRSKRK